MQAITHFPVLAGSRRFSPVLKTRSQRSIVMKFVVSLKADDELPKDLPKPKHEVYLRGVRPVPPCVLTEGPRRGTNFGGCLATAKPNFGQPESVSLLT